jgi:hypothetical protein
VLRTAFGPREPVARARCVVAEAEVALAARELKWSAKSLEAARIVLEEHGDRANAAQARYLEVRRLVLIGRLDDADKMLAALDPGGLPPALRVVHELVGRLRRELRKLAHVSATQGGFALAPREASEVVVLVPPVEDANAAMLGCLADGESWSSSALAPALGTGQRTMQRSLEALAAVGKVQAFGRGRARRWVTPPPPGFTTTLLLPAPL